MTFQSFRRLVTALASGLVLAGASLTAQAALIVPAGSTYDFGLLGQVSGHTALQSVAFDGTTKQFTRTIANGGPTLNMALTESQTDLGNGQFRILFDVTADGDMFPYFVVPGDPEYGLVAMGYLGDPLDLLESLTLQSAIVRVFNGAGSTLASDDFVDLVGQAEPWDGVFPKPGFLTGYGNAGAHDIRRLQLELVVGPAVNGVPEPHSLLLAGLALAAAAVARRRRQG